MPMSVRRIWGFLADRRGQVRRESDLAASFVVLAGAGGEPLGPARAARLINVSAGGGCLALASLAVGQFHLTRCLEAPEEHPLLLTVQADGGRSWRLRGWVRWTNREMQPADEAMPFRVGLQWEPGSGPPRGWQKQLARTTGD